MARFRGMVSAASCLELGDTSPISMWNPTLIHETSSVFARSILAYLTVVALSVLGNNMVALTVGH